METLAEEFSERINRLEVGLRQKLAQMRHSQQLDESGFKREVTEELDSFRFELNDMLSRVASLKELRELEERLDGQIREFSSTFVTNGGTVTARTSKSGESDCSIEALFERIASLEEVVRRQGEGLDTLRTALKLLKQSS